MKNKILFLLALINLNVYANNSDMKITANIQSGCSVTAEDIHFGLIDTHYFLKTNESVISKSGIFSFKCSKGTTFTLVQDGGKNRMEIGVPYWQNAMKRNSLGVATENDLIHYSINVPNASSQVENYIITKAALNDHIINNTIEGTHYLGIKVLNGELSELIYTGNRLVS